MPLKVLISSDGYTAHYFIRMGWARALVACGHEVTMWNIHDRPATDAFDIHEPDLFIGQVYNITPTLIQCIEERPMLKVIMKAPDMGFDTPQIKKDFPHILSATPQDVENVRRLRQTGRPNALFVHHAKEYLESTHGKWYDICPVESLLNAADIIDFYPVPKDDRYASDISFLGGYWPYKAITLDKWILPLCYGEYNIKIFGNQPWPTPYYCGNAGNPNLVFSSSKVCVNVHEPHSQALGYDIIERPFKILACGRACVTDHVQGLVDLKIPGVVPASSPSEFKEIIDELIAEPENEREIGKEGLKHVLQYHTYFDRVSQILSIVGFEDNTVETKHKYVNKHKARYEGWLA